jgi:acyl dehydratase
VLVQIAKDVLGVDGWLWKIKFRYKKMDVAGDTIRARAEVVERRQVGDYGFVTLRVVLTNQHDEVSTAGFAIGVVPLPGGAPVPNTFVPVPAYDAVRLPADE